MRVAELAAPGGWVFRGALIEAATEIKWSALEATLWCVIAL